MIARQLPKRVFVLLAGAWVLIFVLVVPLAKVPHAAGWQQASWLFESARQRVIIWNYIASRVPEAFVLGRGADATPHVPRTSPDTWVESTPVVTVDPRQARHPHNVFLQVWYELGAAGAALVMILGLIALHRSLAAAGRSPAAIMRPAIAAMFASMVVLGAFSYSCWQAWYQAAMMIGVLGAANALGYALRGGTPNETSDAHKDRAP